MLCIRARSHGPAADGLAQCEACLAKENVSRRKRLAAGVCSKSEAHGPSVAGKTMCRVCLDAKSGARKKRVSRGLCINGESHGPRLLGKKMCEQCCGRKKPRAAAKAVAPVRSVVAGVGFVGEGGEAVEIAADDSDGPCM